MENHIFSACCMIPSIDAIDVTVVAIGVQVTGSSEAAGSCGVLGTGSGTERVNGC